ncbi:MAG: hypothetical protein ACK5NB_10930 [Flavobacteriaceae bacterium]
MLKRIFPILVFLFVVAAQAQESALEKTEQKQDSIKKAYFLKHLGNGYFPTKYFNVDLRYLIKFNQYEGFRTGLGGVTNKALSNTFQFNGYGVYGFRDQKFKYSIGGGFKLGNTWLSAAYTDDLQETGSTVFLTDKRLFQFFEPRLLNISLFHKHITKALALEYDITNHLSAETELALSNISPTYDYSFVVGDEIYSKFNLSTAKIALQWSPFSKFEMSEQGVVEVKDGFPKFTFQYTQSIKDAFEGDFNFSKVDFRAIQRFGKAADYYSELILVGGMANGNTPLTHLYHAYPNNINKETIMQRFSVAGNNSFETMFFNEFFSDKFVTLQFKHYVKPFQVSERFKPQLVLTTRYALGNIANPERHQGITFGSLEKGYTESGFELNKLFFGFGLSFTYRYGAYHLPRVDDNVAFKFTFNVTL